MSIGQGNITVQSKKEAGEATQANNGLTLTGNLVQLGGGLIQNTYIGLNSGFEFAFQGSSGDNVLLLDEVNGIYFFGFDTAGDRDLVTGWSFDNTNQIEGRAAAKVGLRIVQTISGFEAYLGDVNNDANGTKIIILDNDNFIEIRNGNAQLFFAERNQAISVAIGDVSDDQNGTKINIDDDNQEVTITNVPTGAITNDFATFENDIIKKIPAPIESGTYTPTITPTANITSATPGTWQFLRVGNVVTVSGAVTVETTAGAGTLTTFDFDCPILTDLVNQGQASGTLWGNTNADTGGQIEPNAGNLAIGKFKATSAATGDIFLHFTYLITAAP